MFGGNKGAKFKVLFKVQLSDDETELIERYKVESEPLLQEKLRLFGREISVSLTIGSLVRGYSFQTESINDILAVEDSVKGACGAFANVLRVMAEFGGTETIDL